MAKLHLRVVTPLRDMYDGKVDYLIVKTHEGQMAFLPNHIPLTTTLDIGAMKISINGEEREAALLGGFVEVLNNNVTVVSDVAEWPEEIDVLRAKEARERAITRIRQTSDKMELRRAELAFRRAAVRLEVSSYPIIKGNIPPH